MSIPEYNLTLAWKTGVELFLNHVEKQFVKRAIKEAIKATESTSDAVLWLHEHGYGSLFGNWGGSGDHQIRVESSSQIKASDYLKIYHGDWKNLILTIPLEQIVKYVKTGEAPFIQPKLF